MDLECEIKAVAGGSALGVIILAKVGGENGEHTKSTGKR